MKNNYVTKFRKAVFGAKCTDVIFRDKDEIVVWFDEAKTKTYTEEQFIEQINLNISCEIGLISNMIDDDWENISINDGLRYKLRFKNGMRHTKTLGQALEFLALVEFSEV